MNHSSLFDYFTKKTNIFILKKVNVSLSVFVNWCSKKEEVFEKQVGTPERRSSIIGDVFSFFFHLSFFDFLLGRIRTKALKQLIKIYFRIFNTFPGKGELLEVFVLIRSCSKSYLKIFYFIYNFILIKTRCACIIVFCFIHSAKLAACQLNLNFSLDIKKVTQNMQSNGYFKWMHITLRSLPILPRKKNNVEINEVIFSR